MQNSGAGHPGSLRARKAPASWAYRRQSTRCPRSCRAGWRFRRSPPAPQFRSARRLRTARIFRAPQRPCENCSRCTSSGRTAPECKRPGSFRRRNYIELVGSGLLHGFAVPDRFAMSAYIFHAHILISQPQAVGARLGHLHREFQDFAAVQDGGRSVFAGRAAQDFLTPFLFASARLQREAWRGTFAAGHDDDAASAQAKSEALLAVIPDAHREWYPDHLLIAHRCDRNFFLRGNTFAGSAREQEYKNANDRRRPPHLPHGETVYNQMKFTSREDLAHNSQVGASGTTLTRSSRLRGPSNSAKKIRCQRPSASFPATIHTVSDDPTRAVLMYESEFPSACAEFATRGTIRSNAAATSCATARS